MAGDDKSVPRFPLALRLNLAKVKIDLQLLASRGVAGNFVPGSEYANAYTRHGIAKGRMIKEESLRDRLREKYAVQDPTTDVGVGITAVFSPSPLGRLAFLSESRTRQ